MLLNRPDLMVGSWKLISEKEFGQISLIQLHFTLNYRKRSCQLILSFLYFQAAKHIAKG